MTMPSVCADETHCPSAFDTVELIAVAIFTLEYVLRVYAAPEAYPVSVSGIDRNVAGYTPVLHNGQCCEIANGHLLSLSLLFIRLIQHWM